MRKDYFTIDFKDPDALRELTSALAFHFFGITLEIPTNRLIPTIPLRLNYLLWIQDLLSFQNTDQTHTGIDIGKLNQDLLSFQNTDQAHFGIESKDGRRPVLCRKAKKHNLFFNRIFLTRQPDISS